MTDPRRYRAYLDLVSGRRRGPTAALARGMLRLASAPYAAAVDLRNAAFNRGWRRIVRVEVPVVSVGNLTTGGTGKTPLVEWIARRLRARGVRVAVLSRGYGAALPEDRADGAGNEETDLLARHLPDVPQLVGPDRAANARVAIDELQMQCLLLDDGFQHRRLARDLDVVLIDALAPFGFGALLPRGLLREPVRALRRADVLVLTRCDQVADVRPLRQRLARLAPGVPVVESRHAPVDVVSGDGAVEPIAWLAGRRVLAVCGIGNPEAFRRTLADCRADVVDFLVFPDHHAYSAADRESIWAAAEEARAQAVVTTEKDLDKLSPTGFPPGQAPRSVWAVRVQLEPTAGVEALAARLDRIAARAAGR